MDLIKDPKMLEFLTRNNLRIHDTGKVSHTPHYVSPVSYFSGGNEKVYSIEITESRLKMLAELESAIVNSLRSTGKLDVHLSLLIEIEEEKQVREQYETVRTAYESYKLLLDLVRDHK